jgi:hypothetical protein
VIPIAAIEAVIGAAVIVVGAPGEIVPVVRVPALDVSPTAPFCNNATVIGALH